MSLFLEKVFDFFKVILVVLGIISPYPRINLENVYVYRDFTNPSEIRAQLRFSHIINSHIDEIIKSGTELEILCVVVTKEKGKIIYRNRLLRKVGYKNGLYQVDNIRFESLQKLKQWVNVIDMTVLTNAKEFSFRVIETEVDLFLRSDLDVDLMLLWGNKPRIILTYVIENSK